MSANKSKIKKKIKVILTITITFVIALLTIMHVFIKPSLGYDLSTTENKTLVFTIYVVLTILLSGVITTLTIYFANKYLNHGKEKLHGLWVYCFLFPAKEVDKEKFVCFSINRKGVSEINVLVVGYIKIHHDIFDLCIINKNGTSKTFLKDGGRLHQRVSLKIKNIDLQGKTDLTLIYETIQSRFVKGYSGVMNWKNIVQSTLVEITNSNRNEDYHSGNTIIYQGLVQDIEPGEDIIESIIYLQQLKHEKTKKEVEAVLEKNLDYLKIFVSEHFNATLITE